MKKLLTLSCLLFFAFCAQAQNTYQVFLTGSVNDISGAGIANQDVMISSDSSVFGSNWSYSNVLVTDGSGAFSDTINVPDTEPFGFLMGSTDNCDGQLAFGFTVYDVSNPNPFMEILYCDTTVWPPLDSCFTSVYCDRDGSLVADAFGNGPFTYSWNTGEITQSIMPQDTGLYCVTVTDADGCVSEGCSHWVGNGGSGIDSCFAFVFEDGLGNLIAEGFGVPPLTYLWDTGETTQQITAGADTTYCVIVTDSEGCSVSVCYDYISNPWGQDSCGVFVSCDPNGVFIADAYGVAPFTYLWNTGEMTANIIPGDPGDYCVTVTDAAGCTSVGCYYFSGGGDPIDSCFAFVDGFGGELSAIAFGTPPYTYTWDNGDTTPNISVSDSSIYCVTITDAVGCVSVACGSTTPNPWGNCIVEIEQTGTGLTANISNPQDYNFEWSTGETTQSISPTETGLYCVTAYGINNNCITEACYFYFNGNPGDSTCTVNVISFDDSLGLSSFFAFGTGVEPFTYVWDTGDNSPFISTNDDLEHCVTITDATGCVAYACSDSNPNGPLSSSVSGYIFTADSTQFPVFVDGTVELIDALTGAVTETTTVVNLQGFPYYDFGDVADGTYIIRAAVSNPNGSTFIPTYHFATTLSGDADEITIPYTADPFFGGGFDILVFETVALAGKGSIFGNVTKEQKFADPTSGQKGDVEGLSIILFDNFGNPIDYFATDASGNFQFPELPYGTYQVYIDVPGHNNEYIMVTLHDDSPEANDLNFNIEDGRISSNAGFSNATEIESVEDLKVYPNPTSGIVTVEIASAENLEMELRLQNVSGVTMISQELKLSNSTQRVQLDLEGLTSGIYFVRLTDGKRNIARKLIVK